MLYSWRRGLDGRDFAPPIYGGQHILERFGRRHKYFFYTKRRRAYCGERVPLPVRFLSTAVGIKWQAQLSPAARHAGRRAWSLCTPTTRTSSSSVKTKFRQEEVAKVILQEHNVVYGLRSLPSKSSPTALPKSKSPPKCFSARRLSWISLSARLWTTSFTVRLCPTKMRTTLFL